MPVGLNSGALATELKDTFQIIVKTGTYSRNADEAANSIRIAPHLYNTDGDIDRLLDALPQAFATVKAAAQEVAVA